MGRSFSRRKVFGIYFKFYDSSGIVAGYYGICGYNIFSQNKVYTSNWVGPRDITKSGGTFLVNGSFYSITDFRSTTRKHFLLRILSFLFGKRVTYKLKNMLILKPKIAPIRMSRKVTFLKKSIEIEDMIESEKVVNLIRSSDGLSFRFVPSSKFFQMKVELLCRV